MMNSLSPIASPEGALRMFPALSFLSSCFLPFPSLHGPILGCPMHANECE